MAHPLASLCYPANRRAHHAGALRRAFRREPTVRAVYAAYDPTKPDAMQRGFFIVRTGDYVMSASKALYAVLIVAILGLAGCNTVAGVGKDLEAGGEKIQSTAQDTKEKM